MMRRIVTALMVVALVMLASTGARADGDVGVDELLIDGAGHSGQTISVVGELIGDYGYRRDGTAWSQLNGDSYAAEPSLEGGPLNGSNLGIGVRAPAGMIRELDPPGDYHHRGPLVRATGIWKYHDEDRGGETYLDVVSIEVLEPGREFDETANPVVVTIGGLLVLVASWLAYRTRKRSNG